MNSSGGRVAANTAWRGRFTTVDVPGAAGTSLTDINDRGQIAGFGFDSDDPFGTVRSFMLERGARGPLTTIRRTGRPATLVTGINDRHQIIGGTVDPETMPAPTVDAT